MQTFSLTDKQKTLRDQLKSSAAHFLLYGGSRSGKTFLLVFAICTRAIMAPGSRHVIFRKHGVSVKQSIGKDTLPKVMELAYPNMPFKWHEQDGYFSFPNGSEVWLAGLDDKERVDKVLGKEYATLYFNEASEIPYPSYIVALTRLAQQVKRTNGELLPQKCYVDLNPTTRNHWTYRLFVDGINPDGEMPVNMDDYEWAVANPTDNLPNLSADYIARLESMPDRQRKRFFDGEYTADVENSLWRRDMIKRVQEVPEGLRRVVTAIDPATTSEIGSDETGVITVGLDSGGNAYVMDDCSGKYKPEQWASKAVAAYDSFNGDRVVGEKNQGGDMVESVLRAFRPDIPYTGVHASRGKVTRAEPVAALYERGKVFHVGRFEALEDQMCSFTSDYDRKAQGMSPDRVDALVWALTELFPKMTRRKGNSKPIVRNLGTVA